MKERWIMSGQYMDGTGYSETFESLSEALDQMWYHYHLASEPIVLINPYTLTIENDNTEKEINKMLGL